MCVTYYNTSHYDRTRHGIVGLHHSSHLTTTHLHLTIDLRTLYVRSDWSTNLQLRSRFGLRSDEIGRCGLVWGRPQFILVEQRQHDGPKDAESFFFQMRHLAKKSQESTTQLASRVRLVQQ